MWSNFTSFKNKDDYISIDKYFQKVFRVIYVQFLVFVNALESNGDGSLY